MAMAATLVCCGSSEGTGLQEVRFFRRFPPLVLAMKTNPSRICLILSLAALLAAPLIGTDRTGSTTLPAIGIQVEPAGVVLTETTLTLGPHAIIRTIIEGPDPIPQTIVDGPDPFGLIISGTGRVTLFFRGAPPVSIIVDDPDPIGLIIEDPDPIGIAVEGRDVTVGITDGVDPIPQ